jgi:hypothetical protein
MEGSFWGLLLWLWLLVTPVIAVGLSYRRPIRAAQSDRTSSMG